MYDTHFPFPFSAFCTRLQRHLPFGLFLDTIVRSPIILFSFALKSSGSSFGRHHESRSQPSTLFLLISLSSLLGKTIPSGSAFHFI
jgi:hypothetical protein